MKRKVFTLFAACTLLLTLNGCKKYEEGPYLSFKSKFDRVVNTWKAKNVFRDQVDVSAWYTDWQLDLKVDGRISVSDRDDLDSLVSQAGFWDLVNHNQDLQLLFTDPPVNPDRKTYQILKLKEEELWMQEITDSVTWQFRLVPALGDSAK